MKAFSTVKIDSDINIDLTTLDNENRLITTPWSRIVRGLGLGQYPVDYNESVSSLIQETFCFLKAKGNYSDNYVNFSALLCDFINLILNPKKIISEKEKLVYIDKIVSLIEYECDPYRRIMQYSITIDALAKLNINVFTILEHRVDLSVVLFNVIGDIKLNCIKDEDKGNHGDYEKLSAYTSVFFALAICDKANYAVTKEHNHIIDALNTLEHIPSPFYRGRSGGMLFSAISLLGYGWMLQDNGRNYLAETLDYLDKVDVIGINPVFPQHMTPEFIIIYPLLTMLNAIAVTGNHKLLHYRNNRIKQAGLLLNALTPIERTHMGLYYIMAMYNLGLLNHERNNIDTLLDDIVHTANDIEPSENYFLHGISCSYVIETASILGRRDLISDQVIKKLVNSFYSMNRTQEDEANRPYPFAYALTTLSEIGHVERLFKPSSHYDGQSAIMWIINNLPLKEDGVNERLYMLSHALINLMLRMRGDYLTKNKIYASFCFPPS